ncbi:MAG: segregation/condensation protein A [Alphaproteobacteria bacterium]|nr:segregation/condensation protein A [Alphaproteobacteria bacterium]
MTMEQAENIDAAALRGESDLVVALEGFDGPIDLLLTLAREQKVDLGKIAILPLAEQYLAYIAEARRLRLEVAADYLVMAAWLAFLKSRLLLPEPEQDTSEPDAAAMAEALKFQLLRLEAMQKAARDIQDRPQLGSDIFARGIPEPVEVEEKPVYYLTIQDLLTAVAAPSRRRKPVAYNIAPTRLFSLEESVARLRVVLGTMPSWSALQAYLPDVADAEQALEVRSALASTFAATLELVKNGELEVRQDGTFAPIYLRRRGREAQPEQTMSEQ